MKKILLVSTFLMLLFSQQVTSQEFIGEVKMFAGNYAPRGWALCEGQLLSINQNAALFSILGTTYGGDGITTFGLPDLRGRVPVGQGTGPGLTTVSDGQKYGASSVTLTQAQLPSHNHSFALTGVTENGTTNNPSGAYPANTGLFDNEYRPDGTQVSMGNGTSTATGGSQPVSVSQPSIGIRFIICTSGIYPSRN